MEIVYNGFILCMPLLHIVCLVHGHLESFESIKCKDGIDDVIIPHISYDECLDECRARALCTGVSHHTLAGVCRVHGEDAQEKISCKGFVYSEKSRWKTTTLKCGDPKCDQNRTSCTHNTDNCFYTDCSVPPQSNDVLILDGNLRTTGARIAYRCVNPFFLNGKNTLSCLASGHWNHPFPICTVSASSAPVKSMTSSTYVSSTTAPDAATISSAAAVYSTAIVVTSTVSLITSAYSTTVPVLSTSSPTAVSAPTSPITSSTPSTAATSSITAHVTTTKSTDDSVDRVTMAGPRFLDCESGWLLDGDTSYCIDNVYRTFDGATEYCRTISAKVAVQNTPEKNLFIKSIFSGQYNYWIGIHLVSSVWVTTNGSSLTHSDWVGDVPTDPLAACAIYLNTNQYKWSAQSCAQTSHTVCEKVTD